MECGDLSPLFDPLEKVAGARSRELSYRWPIAQKAEESGDKSPHSKETSLVSWLVRFRLSVWVGGWGAAGVFVGGVVIRFVP